MLDNTNPTLENPRPKFKPITCPHCGSRELAFVTEYHQAVGCRIISGIAAIVFLFSVLPTLSNFFNPGTTAVNDSTGWIVVSALVFVTAKLAQYFTESQTHVQSICKDCGHLWLLN